jgi:hypothetical protein
MMGTPNMAENQCQCNLCVYMCALYADPIDGCAGECHKCNDPKVKCPISPSGKGVY